jgi:hypothetical protein
MFQARTIGRAQPPFALKVEKFAQLLLFCLGHLAIAEGQQFFVGEGFR